MAAWRLGGDRWVRLPQWREYDVLGLALAQRVIQARDECAQPSLHLMREVIIGNQKPSEAAMHLPLNILIRSHALLLRPTRLAL